MKKGNYLTQHLFSLIGALSMLIAIVGSFLTFRSATAKYHPLFSPVAELEETIDNIDFTLFSPHLNEIKIFAIIIILLAAFTIISLLTGNTGMAALTGIGTAVLIVIIQLVVSNTTIEHYPVEIKKSNYVDKRGKPVESYNLKAAEANKYKDKLANGDVIKYEWSAKGVVDGQEVTITGANINDKGDEIGQIGVGDNAKFPGFDKLITGKKFAKAITFDYKVPSDISENSPFAKKGAQGIKVRVSVKVEWVKYHGEMLEQQIRVHLQPKDEANTGGAAMDGKTGIGAMIMMIFACLGAVSTLVALNRNE